MVGRLATGEDEQVVRERPVRARQRYILYRVFETGTTTPSWSRIRDPIGAFEDGELRLNIDRLSGDIGPLAESPASGTELKPTT